jgi:MOSC domain-containing protein YiiM
MVRRFHQSGRSGFYLAVEREGEVGAGDTIDLLARNERRLTVADLVALYAMDSANQPLLENASDHPSLPAAWRDYFRKRLWAPDA